MEIKIRKGTMQDLNEMEILYDEMNDSLAAGINYPGWIKGSYPVRENARKAIEEGSLYAAVLDGRIAGSVIINQEQEKDYEKVNWGIAAKKNEIFVLHTLVVHPRFLKKGIGKKLLDFSEKLGREAGAKALRLDVYKKNEPAIRLYENFGFECRAVITLGYERYGLDYFKIYEKLL